MTTLPGLPGLPGLSLTAPSSHEAPTFVSQSHITRTQELPPGTEYRFEVSFSCRLSVKLISGTAEYFGTELAPNSKDPYLFSEGTKGAIYTWHGCKLELEGEVESEYVAEETKMDTYANAHFALEKVREQAAQHNDTGPRVLVVGPGNAGKTSVVHILTSYAVKMGRQPLVVNLDPRQGMLSVPGSLTAAAFSSIVDVEEGWGSSPISGPSPIPVKMPLVYHYGMPSPEENGGKYFKPLVTRMALAVTSRLEVDRAARVAGFVIDTSGAMSRGKGGVYENIEHVVSEFSVNIIFVLGSERLYSDLSRKYSHRTTPDDHVTLIRLDKSNGCVDRDEDYMKQFRQAQIRSYFFGHGENTLSPSTHWEDYSEMSIYKVAGEINPAFRSGDDEDDDDNAYGTSPSIFEKVTPSPQMQNSLLAITSARASDSHETIRDASVIGYLYVADVDDAKKKLRLLSPQSGRTPNNAMILGCWPEDVPGLVS
ncbi:pre-mRNA cleavage complex II protein-like protein Clp1 [Delitschia confertaspora ATCC 74209]|uniref:Polynucleotide 5'-hydroxyl-kinase GRC3 n=1 Tax=Delitschia confertaspora ATCC 74209 TaxID=1513339 RepID=A0A9P4JHT9_9PLEO|nr:pre-mRNA cleavage complex II protein-like protein Clp1 [Delitschia confertaspora ATCC 74209]